MASITSEHLKISWDEIQKDAQDWCLESLVEPHQADGEGRTLSHEENAQLQHDFEEAILSDLLDVSIDPEKETYFKTA